MWFSGFSFSFSVIVEMYLWWKLQASLIFKWENLHNWWMTKYFFAPLYVYILYIYIQSKVLGCCIKWHGLRNQPTSTQLRWFGMSWTVEWRKSKSSAYVGIPSKTVGKTFLMKLVEWMPRVCKAVIKAKGGYFEEYIYLDLFKTFLVTTWFHMCYFIVLRSSLVFYNVENSRNKEKHLND